MLDEKDRYFN